MLRRTVLGVPRLAASVSLVIVVLVLAACKVETQDTAAPISNTVTGVVRAPALDKERFARARAGGVFAWLDGLLGRRAVAAVTGLEPVGSATVELVRLDSLGTVVAVLASTTSDPSGVYTFNDTPAPDSTLAVRVIGQPDTMRAIVTGAQVDISPISEVVTDTIIQGLVGGVVLGNFALEEVDALSNLVKGMDIDVSGQTFSQAVASIRSASTPILPDLARGYAKAGVETMLRNKDFVVLDHSAVLKDPYLSGARGVGVGASSYGWLSFGGSDRVRQGSVSVSGFIHDLVGAGLPASATADQVGLYHVVAATGQVSVGGTGGALGGAVTQGGTLMIYPLESTAPGIVEQGLRLGFRWDYAAKLGNKILDDPLVGGATPYTVVLLRERLSGAISAVGANAITAATATGSLLFDSGSQTTRGGSVYGAITSGGLATSPLALDLTSYTVTGGTGSEGAGGIFNVFPDGGILFLNADGSYWAQGIARADGEILAYSGYRDVFQTELDVLANDRDAVGDALTITGVTQPAKGSVAIKAGGKQLLYTPKGDDVAPESFSYTVRDAAAGLTASATVNVGLINVNAAPTGFGDSFTVNSGSTGNLLDVLANDTDAVGDLASVTIVTPPTNGIAAWDATAKKVSYDAGGSATDSFTYTVWDQGGLSYGPVTVNVTVGPNAAPVATNDSFSINMNTSGNVLDVLANDVDAVGDALTIAAIDTSLLAPGASAATDGKTVTYAPAPGYTGVDVLSYTVRDAAGLSAAATVSLTVGANAAPVATDDPFEVNVDNQGERTLGIALRQASGMGNVDVAGIYNVVQHASYFTELGGTSAAVDVGFKYGTLTFDGVGAVSGGSLFRKRASLDIAAAKAGAVSALTVLPTPTAPEAPSGGSYTVAADGTMILSLSIGSETVSGTGAVSQSGELIVLAIESGDSGVAGANGGRGLLILVRQPLP